VKNIVDFSSNDYLGIASSINKNTTKNIISTIDKYGYGAKSSRLLGNLKIYDELENLISKTKGFESSLLFASGFQANIGVLSALLDKKILGQEALVFADRLNHSSLIQGCMLANTKQIRYSHLDMEMLEEKLNKYSDSTRAKFIVTESVFGMDGDYIDIEKIICIAKKYNAFLYIDEAHSTGIMGKNGYGITSGYGKDIDVVMGTFSKAIGGSGAYVSSNLLVKKYLVNSCSSQIYSTAISPIMAVVAKNAWEQLPNMQNERRWVLNLAKEFCKILANNGVNACYQKTPIVPVILHSSKMVMHIKNRLLNKGFLVSAIREPTVPKGTARLRFSFCAFHTKKQIEQCSKILLEEIKKI
jgi:8-amino-7-oxononanoate synthase